MTKKYKSVINIPRLPLEGSIDLTYRCNNHCRHCWLWVPDQAEVRDNELAFDEIRRIVDEARAMGCRYWRISGGEPLLRPDFPEIFDYVMGKAIGYTLNTNGTLLTPKISKQLKRNGNILVALYGATAEIYDYVTRNPGGFDKAMQGFSYLKEANVPFTVQLIPMQANWHQWQAMIDLARTLSPIWRIGAPWLFLSSSGSLRRNREIIEQRLSPQQLIEIEPPYSYYEKTIAQADLDSSVVEKLIDEDKSTMAIEEGFNCGYVSKADDRLFSHCIESRRDFHVDPYGQASWCAFIKDPAMRYNLRSGSFQEAWEIFIPSCADKIRGGDEWRNNCGSCEKRSDCKWCAVYAFLETGRYSAPVPYLCSVTDAIREFKIKWQKSHRRFFQIAGITICLESSIGFDAINMKEEIKIFAVDSPSEVIISLHHHFDMPDLRGKDLGKEIYQKPPWIISCKDDNYFVQEIITDQGENKVNRLAIFSDQFTRGIIYNSPNAEENVIKHGWHTLSLLPTDHFWLGPVLSARKALLINSAAAIVNGRGILFVSYPEAKMQITKRFIMELLYENGLQSEILCDDRSIIRHFEGGWKVYGISNKSSTDNVSLSYAPLQSIIFIERSPYNQIKKLTDRKSIRNRFLAVLARPIIEDEWWLKELEIVEQIIEEIPFYYLSLNKSKAIISELKRLNK